MRNGSNFRRIASLEYSREVNTLHLPPQSVILGDYSQILKNYRHQCKNCDRIRAACTSAATSQRLTFSRRNQTLRDTRGFHRLEYSRRLQVLGYVRELRQVMPDVFVRIAPAEIEIGCCKHRRLGVRYALNSHVNDAYFSTYNSHDSASNITFFLSRIFARSIILTR